MSLFTPGTSLGDRYRLVVPIGAGGMSQVWRASDELLGRPVAVKVLAAPLAEDPSSREATWREARAAARLNHPHITQVHDYGELPLPGGGVAGYLVMELVTGQTLAHRLAPGGLPWPEAARVAGQVAAALAAAHQLGVVHRDIKPGNVMLTEAGVKVLDFGIAAMAGAVDPDQGRLVGTPAYAAPERLDTAASAHPASDVYSLGGLLYEALCGHPPASFATWSEAAAGHRDGAWPPPLTAPGVPDELVELCQACLGPAPAGRPTAAQAARLLADLADGAAGGREAADNEISGGGGEAGGVTVTGALPIGAAPTVPSAGRYVPGAAALPLALPATAIDDHGARRSPGRRRRLRAGLTAAAVVVALLVAGALLALLSSDWRSGTTSPPEGGGPAEAAETEAAEPAATGTAGPESGPAAGAMDDSPSEIISEFDRSLLAALDAGALTRDGFDDLRDELDDLRDALAEGDPAERAEKLRDEAEDLLEEIGDLRAEGELDQATADHLTGLLAPLLAE